MRLFITQTILALLLAVSSALAADPVTQREIPYAEPRSERQMLDLYAPAEGKNHPIVIWIHGGGWEKGDKADMGLKPQACVDRGYLLVSVDYRLLPGVTIKQMTADVAKAVRWTCDHAKDYGGDTDKVFLAGYAAGAQLAALICTDGAYLKAEGLKLSVIKRLRFGRRKCLRYPAPNRF